MFAPSKQLLHRLDRAAELRANGIGWNAIARTLKCRPKTCRSWSMRYPRIWAILQVIATRAALRDAQMEALHTLRLLMRSSYPKVAFAAIKTVMEYTATWRQNSASAASSRPRLPG